MLGTDPPETIVRDKRDGIYVPAELSLWVREMRNWERENWIDEGTLVSRVNIHPYQLIIFYT